MNSAFVTMCSRADIERCQLLVESIDEFVPPSVRHYIVVDKRDFSRFKHLKSARREVLRVEDILPWWIMRVPRARRWWLSLKSVPLRNWFLQQLVKLSISLHVDDDIIIFVDADVALFRPFDPNSWVKEDKVRLFRVPGANATTQCPWHRTAGQLLGLGEKDYFGASYIGNLIPWRRDNVIKLHEHIASLSGRGWLETVCRHWHLSEYVLYGVFVEHVLGEDSGHYYESRNVCHTYWGTEVLSEEELRAFVGDVETEHAAIMISSKAGISPQRYRSLLRGLGS